MIETPDAAPPQPDTPAPHLLPQLAAVAERRRRRGRLVAVGGAIAAAVAIAVPVVSDVTGSNTPPAAEQVFAERQMQPLDRRRCRPTSSSSRMVSGPGWR